MNAGFFIRSLLVLLPVFGVALGFALPALGLGPWQDSAFAAFTIPVLVVLSYDIVASLRRGEVGLDIVALLSMAAALFVGEELAAVVVALMYAGGQFLEAYAERHARREMTALLARVPRTAVRHRGDGLEEVALDLVAPGDRLLIRQGDVVPVDGVVASGLAVLDQSALTGESIPVEQKAGETVMSGSTNAGEAFDLTASHRAAESTYAGIVRLVDGAQRSKAPMSRLADRFALAFLAVTVLIAALAWFFTGDPVRAVAVLVIATPCPLILAVPVAIVSGLSRAARHGILIKGGKAMEALARIQSLVLDKTGTLTDGRAKVVAIDILGNDDQADVFRLAASLDQASKHIIAQTIVAEAQNRQLSLTRPSEVVETPGEGVEGVVEGRKVAVGGLKFVRSKLLPGAESPDRSDAAAGGVVVAIAIDGRWAGEIRLADELRAGTEAFLQHLRTLGVERVVLATGDRREVAETIVAGLGFDAVRAGLTPDQKVLVVLSERKSGPVMMIGDGVNDAPAMANATVGIAMGAAGSDVALETADVALMADDLANLPFAVGLSRTTRSVILQNVFVSLGVVAFLVPATILGLGIGPAVAVHEGSTLLVVFNALRLLAYRDKSV